MGIKVTHKAITFDFFENVFKKGTPKTEIMEGELWDGAFLIYSKLDKETRMLHFYFFDPINGIEIVEGQDITSIPISDTIFKRID